MKSNASWMIFLHILKKNPIELSDISNEFDSNYCF